MLVSLYISSRYPNQGAILPSVFLLCVTNRSLYASYFSSNNLPFKGALNTPTDTLTVFFCFCPFCLSFDWMCVCVWWV